MMSANSCLHYPRHSIYPSLLPPPLNFGQPDFSLLPVQTLRARLNQYNIPNLVLSHRPMSSALAPIVLDEPVAVHVAVAQADLATQISTAKTELVMAQNRFGLALLKSGLKFKDEQPLKEFWKEIEKDSQKLNSPKLKEDCNMSTNNTRL